MVTVADGKGGTKMVEMTTAEDVNGIRKNIETNKNINHGGHTIKSPLKMAFDFLSGNTDSDEILEDGSIVGTFNNPDTKGLSTFKKIKADYDMRKDQSMLTAENVRIAKEIKRRQEEEKRIRDEKSKQDAIKAAEQQALNDAYNAQTQASRNRQDQAGGSGGGQFDGASSKSSYDSDPTSYSGSFAKGGRAGYFFGGRVNYKIGGRVGFKNGGLASIL